MAKNLGDSRLWRNIDAPVYRGNYANQDGMTNVIFPENPDYEGDIVPIGDYAGRNFDYVWHPVKGEMYEPMEDLLRDKGYERVTLDKFKVNRWRQDASGSTVWYGHALWARPAELGIEQELKEMRRNNPDAEAEARLASFHEIAAEEGAGTFIKKGGKIEEVVKPRK